MSTIRRRAARKAAKATARHAAHGAVARGRRKPLRSVALLGAGAGLGAAAGWIAGRHRPGPPAPAQPAAA